MTAIQKPLPVVPYWAKKYWESAKEHKLTIQKCADCGAYVFYPKLFCTACNSENLEWIEASGKGKIYSYTVVMTNASSGFQDDVPFVVAIVRLDEGVKMMTNIVDCDPMSLYCEMPVEVTFEKLNDDFTLPKFKPVTK